MTFFFDTQEDDYCRGDFWTKLAFSFWLLAIGKKAKSKKPIALLLKTETSDNQ